MPGSTQALTVPRVIVKVYLDNPSDKAATQEVFHRHREFARLNPGSAYYDGATCSCGLGHRFSLKTPELAKTFRSAMRSPGLSAEVC